MPSTKFFSLRLPFGMYVHYAKGRKIGESRPAYDKGLVHYNRRGKMIGKMVRSFFGEPNHYDLQRHCIGYSRRKGLSKIIHYGRDGGIIGHTYHLFHVLYFHRVPERSDLLSAFSKRRYKKEEQLCF